MKQPEDALHHTKYQARGPRVACSPASWVHRPIDKLLQGGLTDRCSPATRARGVRGISWYAGVAAEQLLICGECLRYGLLQDKVPVVAAAAAAVAAAAAAKVHCQFQQGMHLDLAVPLSNGL